MREQSAWALGNGIAGDCVQTRDMVLQHGGMTQLLALVERGGMSFCMASVECRLGYWQLM